MIQVTIRQRYYSSARRTVGRKKKIDKKTVVDLLMSNELFLISLPPLSHFLLHLHFIFIMHNLIVTRWIDDSIESPFFSICLTIWIVQKEVLFFLFITKSD
jgi:hypothetical protein